MKRKTFIIVFSILMALILALVWWTFCRAEEPEWTVCYPMANQHVEWTGAGYGGAGGK